MIDYRAICKDLFPEYDPLLLSLFVNMASTNHKHDATACAISVKLVRSCGFSDARFFKWIKDNKLGTFCDDYKFYKTKTEDDKWNKIRDGYCKRFLLSEKAINMCSQIQKRDNWKLGDKIRRIKNSSKGIINLSEHEIVVDHPVFFSIQEANKLTKHSNRVVRNWAQMLINDYPNGQMPHKYFRNRTGRLTAIGYSFQNAPKIIRERVLKFNYSYDIQASQQSIASQIAQRISTRSNLTLDEYVNNRSKFRSKISKQTGFSIPQVKDILQRLTFGAKLKYNNNCCIYNDYGSKGLETVINNTTLNNYYKDMNNLSKETSKHPTLAHWYSNIKDPAKRFAYIMQNIESQILDVMSEKVIFCYNYVPLHDGIITDERLDVEETQRRIKEKTGFDVKIEEKYLK